MMKKRLLCIFALSGLPLLLQAAGTTSLHEGWRLQSACKLQAGGDAIASPGFTVGDWVKTAVPSTVLAAQAAAGVVPDPYFGSNLRQIPGTTYPIGKDFSNLPMPADSPYHCGWWYRTQFAAPAAAGTERFWLHFGGINYGAEIWANAHKMAD